MALPPGDARVRDLLLKARVVDEYQMRAALGRLAQWGGRLPRVLADMGMVTEEETAQLLADSMRLQVVLLGTVARDAAALGKLDVRFCEAHAVFPVSLNPATRTLVLAMADPTALDVVDLVAARAGARVQVVVATESQILAAVAKHYRGAEPPPTTPQSSRQSGLVLPPAAAAQEIELEPSPSATRQQAAPAPAGSQPAAATFTHEELERLASLQQTQARTAVVLAALQALLTEKGLLE